MTDPGQPRRHPQADSSPASINHAQESLDPVNLLDQAIDTVLTSLRETQPSPGLHRRLLETLATHQTPIAIPWARRLLPRRTSLRALRPSQAGRAVGGLSLAATLVVTLSLAVLHQHHPAAIARPAATQSATTLPPPVSGTSVVVTNSPSDSCCRSGPEPAEEEDPPHSALNHAAQRRAPRHAATSPASQLASFPAPPLPLTEQEKLLLRVARAQNPQQSPVLNPALRASLAARDDENFQIFFAPATTIKPYEPAN